MGFALINNIYFDYFNKHIYRFFEVLSDEINRICIFIILFELYGKNYLKKIQIMSKYLCLENGCNFQTI